MSNPYTLWSSPYAAMDHRLDVNKPFTFLLSRHPDDVKVGETRFMNVIVCMRQTEFEDEANMRSKRVSEEILKLGWKPDRTTWTENVFIAPVLAGIVRSALRLPTNVPLVWSFPNRQKIRDYDFMVIHRLPIRYQQHNGVCHCCISCLPEDIKVARETMTANSSATN